MQKILKISLVLLATLSTQAQNSFSFDTELVYLDQNKEKTTYLVNSKEDYILDSNAKESVLIYKQTKFHYSNIESEYPTKIVHYGGDYNEINPSKRIKFKHNNKRKKGYEINMKTPVFKQLLFSKNKKHHLVTLFENVLKSKFDNSKIKGLPYRIITASNDTLSLVDFKNIKSTVSYNLVEKPREVVVNSSKINSNGKFPIFKFEEVIHDFGTITQGESVEHIFKFVNTGDAPLLISNARASCGCTIPNYPKTAIIPGDRSEIRVRFNSRGKRGKTSKRITISDNSKTGKTYLTIKADIKIPDNNSLNNTTIIQIPRTSNTNMNKWLSEYNLTTEKLKYAIKGKRKKQERLYSNQLQGLSERAVELFQNISNSEANRVTLFIQKKNEEIIKLKNAPFKE